MHMRFGPLLGAPLANPRLWLTLGWQEIVQSYRRTFLGPIWISLNMVVFVVAMTLVYSALFGVPTTEYAAYVASGISAWFWILGILTDAGNTFQNYSHFIRSQPIDKAQLIWGSAYKQIVILAHHLVVYLALSLVGIVRINANTAFALPAVAVLFLMSIPATAILSILYARFRDLQKLISSVTIVLMMITPIFWQPSLISGWRSAIIHLNPFYYWVEFLRRPLLGQPLDATVVVVVLALTAMLWVVGAIFFARYRRYVVFWI